MVAAISETTRFHYLVLESSWSRPRKSDGASWHAKKGESEKPWEKPKAMAHARKFTPGAEDPREQSEIAKVRPDLWTTGPSRGADNSDIPEITTRRFIGRDQVAEGVCRSRQIDGTKSSPSE